MRLLVSHQFTMQRCMWAGRLTHYCIIFVNHTNLHFWLTLQMHSYRCIKVYIKIKIQLFKFLTLHVQIGIKFSICLYRYFFSALNAFCMDHVLLIIVELKSIG